MTTISENMASGSAVRQEDLTAPPPPEPYATAFRTEKMVDPYQQPSPKKRTTSTNKKSR